MSANDHTIIARPEQAAKAEQSCPLQKGTLLEGFEIQEVIGVGGFGIVYRAKDTTLERSVALKEYFPSTLVSRQATGELQLKNPDDQDMFDTGKRSFVNEARLLAQFDHPGLVKVFRFWENAHTAYMVMPMYEGPTLKALRDAQATAFDHVQVLRWLITLTDALQTMHDKQCVHRDISPENILVQSGSQHPVLLDFGAARQAIGQAAQPFTVILKASYAPIEQYSETPGLDQGPWTDVYALAAVAYFLITGRKPPTSVSRMVNDSYQPLVNETALNYPTSLLAAIDQALQVLPSDRTQNMIEFRRALEGSPTQLARNGAPDVLALFETETRTSASAARRSPSNRPTEPKASTFELRKARLLGAMVVTSTVLVLWWGARSSPEPTIIETAPAALDTPSVATPKTPKHADVAAVFHSTLDERDHLLHIELASPTLKVGRDLLDFTVHSPISGHLSVFVLTSENTLLRLLPNPRVPVINIVAGVPLHLPPVHDPVVAAGPVGRNEILVTVTQHRRSSTHLELTLIDGFEQVRTAAAHNTNSRSLFGNSPCTSHTCEDAGAAGWFVVHAVN
jgi:serine/threonine protein kinase